MIYDDNVKIEFKKEQEVQNKNLIQKYKEREELIINLENVNKRLKELDEDIIKEMESSDIKEMGALKLVVQERYTINEEEVRKEYPNWFEKQEIYKFKGDKKIKEFLVSRGFGELKESKYLKHKFIKKK